MATGNGNGSPPPPPGALTPDLGALYDPAKRDALMAQQGTAAWLATNHPGWWFALFGVIIDKRNRTRPVVGTDPVSGKPYEGVNILQWQFFDAAAYFYHLDLPFRGIGLKPRKTGLSTAVQAYLYWRHRLNQCESLTFADKDLTSAIIHRIFATFSRHDGMDWGTTVKAANQAFIFSNGSMAERETVRNTNLGRARTPLLQHRSEVAHFLEAEKLDAGKAMLAANEATSLVPGSFIINESTPNGLGNYFAREYRGDPDGDSPELRLPAVSFEHWLAGKRGNGYVKFFAPWFKFIDNDDATATPAELAHIRATLQPKEILGIRAHKWTLSQISWRRKKVAECKSELLFIQEHTEDEELCFLVSGRPFFDIEAVQLLMARARAQAPQVGRLIRQPNGRVMFQIDSHGLFQIWEMPTHGYPYLFVADTMTGASQVNDPRKADTHACFMGRGFVTVPEATGTRTLRPRVAARIASPFQYDTKQALEEVGLLIDFYSGPSEAEKVLSAVEVNGSGLSWVDRMPELGYPVCRHDVDPINIGKAPSRRRGWLTTPTNRRPMLDALADMVRDVGLDIECPTAIGQMQTFVYHADGKIEAAAGNLDDDVMALAIFAYNVNIARATL